jgi:microcystin-dependent protein
MSDPYIGEIKMVGFDFAPSGYAFCDGRSLPVNQYQALFAVIQVTYGGDGRMNFLLPNLQACAPMGQGAGPGLTVRMPGQVIGDAAVTVTVPQLASHSHQLNGGTLTTPTPAQNVAAPTSSAMFGLSAPNAVYATTTTPLQQMSPSAIGPAGGGQSHENRQPFLAVNFAIALTGVFPSRN